MDHCSAVARGRSQSDKPRRLAEPDEGEAPKGTSAAEARTALDACLFRAQLYESTAARVFFYTWT